MGTLSQAYKNISPQDNKATKTINITGANLIRSYIFLTDDVVLAFRVI